jgi:hypothetical protein
LLTCALAPKAPNKLVIKTLKVAANMPVDDAKVVLEMGAMVVLLRWELRQSFRLSFSNQLN